MSNQGQGPISMEGSPEEPAVIKGREVNPDKDSVGEPNKEVKPISEHMKEILKHVPEILKERVSKMQREELSLPGMPKDREAYEAYLGAEKMIRDLRRRKAKKEFSWDGLPKQNG